MSATNNTHPSARRIAGPLIIVLALLLSILPLPALAQEGSTAIAIGPHIVTLQPGAKTEITVHGFCLNYGLPFPGAELKPVELAADPLRNAAIYGLANEYIDSKPFDVEKAIWFLSDGTRLNGQDYTLADQIVAYANSGVQPADAVAGVPHMADKLADGSLEAVVTGFVNVAPEKGSFYGTGTLVITNVSKATQRFVISYGTVSRDEAAGDQQNMLVFPSDPAPVMQPPETGALLPPAGLALVALAALGLGIIEIGRVRRRAAKAE